MSPSFVLSMLLLCTSFTQNNGVKMNWSNFKNIVKDQADNLEGLYGSQLAAVGGLAKYDPSVTSDLEKALTIADAVVPVIAAGLNFIPVVGPIISGIFSGLWNIFSPAREDPVAELEKKLVKYIKESIEAAEKRMNATVKATYREIVFKNIAAEDERNK